MTDLAKHLLAASAAVLAAGSAVVFAAGAAQAKDITVYAEPAEDALTRTVRYADLNLAATDGQKSLHGRVGRAVRFVCAPFDARIDASNRRECVNFAWDGARPQMARAIERAQQIAATGTSNIAPVAIAVRGAAQ
jgi:UrcA family protein